MRQAHAASEIRPARPKIAAGTTTLVILVTALSLTVRAAQAQPAIRCEAGFPRYIADGMWAWKFKLTNNGSTDRRMAGVWGITDGSGGFSPIARIRAIVPAHSTVSQRRDLPYGGLDLGRCR